MNTDNSAEILKIDFECSTCNKAKMASRHIPVQRVIEKLDRFFDTNDLAGARSLLEYWQAEAQSVGDASGELSIVNEMLGLYRKTAEKEKGQNAVARALELLALTGKAETISGATILINAATTSKAFDEPEKAVLLYEKATKIYKDCGVLEDDLQFAALYNNFAITLVDLENFERAKEFYEKAIAITSRQVESLLDCAVSYVNLAHLYERWQGIENEHIEPCLKKAEALLGDERLNQNAYYAFVCEKCAPSFDYFGYFMLAKKLNDKAREIYGRS
ncbi:MAG: tetratricopeptide repeat protein [Clostridia bacterium]|nr:tetratricopeptide repeat protein [Clostridia bacterium]